MQWLRLSAFDITFGNKLTLEWAPDAAKWPVCKCKDKNRLKYVSYTFCD